MKEYDLEKIRNHLSPALSIGQKPTDDELNAVICEVLSQTDWELVKARAVDEYIEKTKPYGICRDQALREHRKEEADTGNI